MDGWREIGSGWGKLVKVDGNREIILGGLDLPN